MSFLDFFPYQTLEGNSPRLWPNGALIGKSES